MPWDAKTFKARHANHLTLEQAHHGATVANAMLAAGAPEGEAIATGIARAEGKSPKHHAQPFGSLAP